jgi:hypothetical protein
MLFRLEGKENIPFIWQLALKHDVPEIKDLFGCILRKL